MSGPVILARVLRPDGSVAAEGPLVADLIVDVFRAEKKPWRVLARLGWRVEHVGP